MCFSEGDPSLEKGTVFHSNNNSSTIPTYVFVKAYVCHKITIKLGIAGKFLQKDRPTREIAMNIPSYALRVLVQL